MSFSATALTDRTVLSVGGEGATDFLQGLLTNDIQKTTENNAIFALILTPQGKYLYDLFIHKRGDDYLLDCEAVRAEELLKALKRYRLRAKVTLESAELHVVADATQGDVADPRHADMGYRSYVTAADVGNDRTEYEAHRITLGVPDPMQDMMAGESFPLQHRMEEAHAIDYQKGCYVGQEVTARTHYRGTVRKNLFVVQAKQPLPAPGTEITADGKKLGQLRSISGTIGLALLDVTAAETGAPMEVDGVLLRASTPEWYSDETSEH